MYLIFKKIQSIFYHIFQLIVYTAYVIIPVSLFTQVIFRYFFKHPLLGIEEIASVSFIWMVIFGIAVLFKEKKYIIVDALSQKFPEKIKSKVTLINEFIMTVILAILIYSSYISIPFLTYYKSVVLGIPKSAHTIAFIISLIFMLTCSLESIVLNLKQDKVNGNKKI
jgi:TRAP-type C4-dicarboxylate transport system permease small subunit